MFLNNYFYPWELEQAIVALVEYHYYQRYHESLQNLITVDDYLGSEEAVLSRREQIKQ